MRISKLLTVALGATFLTTFCCALTSAEARSLKWARGADALTLDPHAQNEGPTIAFGNQVYETLVARDNAHKLIPGLAVSWRLVDPTTWEFKLRQGVKFHGGESFTADDVVFSYQRALSPTSDYKGYLASVKEIVKVDDSTVQLKTGGPNPLVADNLTSVFIMSKKWAEANNAVKPQDFKNREENFAVRNANGTGPFMLVSREPDVKTVVKRNEAYWGRGEVPLEVTELVLTTIKQDATRVAALLSGEVDVVQDVPVQDIERLKGSPSLRVTEGPENRSIFLGFDVGSAELASSDVKGQEPVRRRTRAPGGQHGDQPPGDPARRDARTVGCRRLDRRAVRQRLQKGIRQRSADRRRQGQGAARLGRYPNGFSVSLHCPNDRYLNDEAICQAAVGMLGQAGIRINLISQSKSLHFPALQNLKSDFFLLGWGVPTYDSDYIFSYLYHTREGARGGWNSTRYSNPEVDKQIQSLSTETDKAKRDATITAIWDKLLADQVYVAIHHQMLAHAMKSDIDVPVRTDNIIFFKHVAFKKS
jgi:peptide/nickel transport system substrate-binding protein